VYYIKGLHFQLFTEYVHQVGKQQHQNKILRKKEKKTPKFTKKTPHKFHSLPLSQLYNILLNIFMKNSDTCDLFDQYWKSK
jgi:hypothetical protein